MWSNLPILKATLKVVNGMRRPRVPRRVAGYVQRGPFVGGMCYRSMELIGNALWLRVAIERSVMIQSCISGCVNTVVIELLSLNLFFRSKFYEIQLLLQLFGSWNQRQPRWNYINQSRVWFRDQNWENSDFLLSSGGGLLSVTLWATHAVIRAGFWFCFLNRES